MAVFVDDHVVAVWRDPAANRDASNLITCLYWGDELLRFEPKGDFTLVRLPDGRDGWIRSSTRTRGTRLLALAFVDVGQGDACVITTPNGHRVLVDGGETQRLARYLAACFWPDTLAGRDVIFDAVVLTHGDADHFAGVSELILDAAKERRDRKRIRFATKRVFHNGLVKRSARDGKGHKRPEIERLGPVIEDAGRLLLPEVVDDPRQIFERDRNRPFRRWCRALDELEARHPLIVRRLDHTARDAFDFLDDVEVDLLGPRIVRSSSGRPALPMLNGETRNSPSCSRSINGHSVLLRLGLGRVRVLLTGDLTADVEADLLREAARGRIDIAAEVLKVPHHGSSDVDVAFLRAVKPAVSIISAGDEDARRDYLHPRANVLGALGQAGRTADPLIFVTNLAAFDRWVGPAYRAVKKRGAWKPDVAGGTFYARERSVHGIVHVRTDGEELLVCRPSARRDRQEAYAFRVADDGAVTALPVRRA